MRSLRKKRTIGALIETKVPLGEKCSFDVLVCNYKELGAGHTLRTRCLGDNAPDRLSLLETKRLTGAEQSAESRYYVINNTIIIINIDFIFIGSCVY